MRSGILPLRLRLFFKEVPIKMDKTMKQGLEMLMGFMKREQAEKIERFRHLNRYVKKGQIVFAGSSLMEQFPIYEFLQDFDLPYTIYNRGVGGYTTADLMKVLPECIFDLEPSVLFLNIGTNDISDPNYTCDALMDRYAKILDAIRERLPKTRLFLLAYYPCNPDAVADGTAEFFRFRTNERIDEANQGVQALAERYGAEYLDLNTGLKDEAGRLKAEFTIEGVHMFADGYREVLDALLPTLKSLN